MKQTEDPSSDFQRTDPDFQRTDLTEKMLPLQIRQTPSEMSYSLSESDRLPPEIYLKSEAKTPQKTHLKKNKKGTFFNKNRFFQCLTKII